VNHNSTRKHMDIAPQRPHQSFKKSKTFTYRQKLGIGLVLLILVIFVVGGRWFIHRNDLRVDTSQYHALLLDNDQFFFGKLQNTNGEYLTLKNAYYVKGADQLSSDGQTLVTQTPSMQKLNA
jgi:hypothetical protein